MEGSVGAACRGCSSMQKRARMKPTGGVTGAASGVWLGARALQDAATAAGPATLTGWPQRWSRRDVDGGYRGQTDGGRGFWDAASEWTKPCDGCKREEERETRCCWTRTGRCEWEDEQGAQLTIFFCAATGAGSSLYFRGLSGACDCDIVMMTASGAETNRRPVRRGPGRRRTRVAERDAVA